MSDEKTYEVHALGSQRACDVDACGPREAAKIFAEREGFLKYPGYSQVFEVRLGKKTWKFKVRKEIQYKIIADRW